MRLAFIGAGKVGVTLGKYLSASANCTIGGYYSRRKESALKAADYTNSKVFATLEELIKESDAIFITVPDGMISAVYKELSCHDISGKQIIHCSGSLSSELFYDISEHKAVGLSIHPLYAFSQPYGDNSALQEAVFTIESNQNVETAVVDYWKELLEQKGNSVVLLDTEKKTKYHCAAVFSSNLFMGLLECGISMFEECGFSQEEAMKAMKPLTMNNLDKAFMTTPAMALTGPVERADICTIEKHLTEMDEETYQIYRLLSKRVLKLAMEKNPDRDYSKIEEILK